MPGNFFTHFFRQEPGCLGVRIRQDDNDFIAPYRAIMSVFSSISKWSMRKLTICGRDHIPICTIDFFKVIKIGHDDAYGLALFLRRRLPLQVRIEDTPAIYFPAIPMRFAFIIFHEIADSFVPGINKCG